MKPYQSRALKLWCDITNLWYCKRVCDVTNAFEISKMHLWYCICNDKGDRWISMDRASAVISGSMLLMASSMCRRLHRWHPYPHSHIARNGLIHVPATSSATPPLPPPSYRAPGLRWPHPCAVPLSPKIVLTFSYFCSFLHLTCFDPGFFFLHSNPPHGLWFL